MPIKKLEGSIKGSGSYFWMMLLRMFITFFKFSNVCTVYYIFIIRKTIL